MRRRSRSRSPSNDPDSEALRLLAERPRTRAELRTCLSERGHAPDSIEAVLSRLESDGLLDDRKLSRHFLLTRADRNLHGRRRLLAELGRRGVAKDVAEAAWNDLLERGDLDPGAVIVAAVRRRVAAAGGRLDRRRYAAVYNALLRAGFEPEPIRVALAPYRIAGDDPEDDPSESVDDFP